MAEILAIATLLGGIAAAWFFYDKYREEIRNEENVVNFEPASNESNISEISKEIEKLAARSIVKLPDGSEVIGEPWPHNEEDKARLARAREILHKGTSMLAIVPVAQRDELAQVLARFEQRIQLYNYGELALVQLDREEERLKDLINSIEGSDSA